MAEFEFIGFKEEIKQYLKKSCLELGADAATFYFYDKASNQYFFPVSHGLNDEQDFERGIPNMNRPPGQVAQKGRPVFAEDVNVSGLAGPFSYTEKVVSLAALPLGSEREVLGAVFFNYRQAHQFPEEEQTRVKEKVKDLTADILRLAQRVESDKLVPETITKAIQQVREDVLLQDIADTAAQALEDATIIIWLPDGETLRSRVIAGVEIPLQNVPSIDVNTQDPVARAFKKGVPVSIDDVRKNKDFQLTELRQELRWRTVEAAPIQNHQDEILGVMVAYTMGHLKFTTDEKALLHALANSAAYSLESEKKIDSLNALHALGTRLTLPSSLVDTLKEIVTATPGVIGADICTIHLYDAAKQEFEDIDKSAVYGADAQNMNKPGAGGLAYRVIERTWIISENVPDETFDASSTFVREENVRAYAGVSLQVVNEPVGVMFISYRQPHKFTADERTLLRTISFYAATAVYVAKLFDQRDAFSEIAREITTAQNREELLKIVLDRSLELLGSEYGSIGLFDPGTQEIHIDYAVGTDVHVIPVGKGLSRRAIETGRPVRVDDVGQEKSYFSRRPDTKSELDVPLIRGNQVIGVLNVETARLAAYTEEHEKLAAALAAQTVVALDKIELLEQIQAELDQRLADIEVLQEVYGALETDELEDALGTVVQHAVDLTGAKYGAIYVIDRSAQYPELYLVAQPGRRVLGKEREERILVDTEKGRIPFVARTGETHRCADVSQDNLFYSSHEDVRSELTVPLKYGDRVYGVIDLESTALSGFDERDERLVRSLAGAAAAAVRQIELFNDLEAVNRLSQKLNSTTYEAVQEVLELVHESASELMDTNNMYIALYDDYKDIVRFGLVYSAGKRIEIEQDKGLQPRQAGSGKTEWIIRNKDALFHPTATESKAWYKQEGHIEYTATASSGSWVGVPMIANEQVLGVVAAFHPTQDYVYSKDDLTSLQAMANQAAVAISNVRLAQQRQLREMGQLLSANIYLSEKELLEIIYQQANQLMHTDEMYIALYDRATDIVRFGLAFQDGKRIDVETHPKWQPRRSGSGRTEAIIKTKEPLFHPTGESSKEWYEQEGHMEYVGLPDFGSWIGVPMIVGGDQVVGVISVWHPEKDYAYDGHDLSLLQTLAAIAASALDNARRFRESQALQELAALGTAMSAIQHRINNTLNIVSPNVTRLRKRVNETDQEIQAILDIIDRNVTYTSLIIHRIQEALRGERQVVNINSILHDVARQAEQHWQTEATGPVEVIPELDDTIPQFEGPIGQISELFTNLANNACRAMIGGGKLNIRSKLDNGIIYVRVKDTGPGIAASILPRLFTRPVPTKETGGTSGLGLYLGSLIAQSLGGNIEVEATGQNGTTMLVRVPVPRR